MDALYLIDYIFFLVLAFLFGGVLGSFSTALIHRLPLKLSTVWEKDNKSAARSKCPECGHALGFLDLIPFFSYVLLRGKCRYCRKPIAIQYWLVEFSVIVSFYLTFVFYGLGLESFFICLSIPALISLFVIDLKHFILPNVLVAWLFLIGILMSMFSNLGNIAGMEALYSAGIYALVIWCVSTLYSKLMKKDVLGFGDVKFFAAAGAWLGVALFPVFIVLAGGLGVVHGGIRRVFYKDSIFPFGPSLILSLCICYIFKEKLLSLLY